MVSIVNKYSSFLSDCSQTPLQDARALLSYAVGGDPLLLWRSLTAEEEAKMACFIEKRRGGVPVAYIVGEKEFMSLPFFVNGHTLIPRPDTEIIVETLITLYKDKSPKILDLCCGSGCIGISLAHFLPRASVKMTDVSVKALEVADENIRRHNLADRVSTSRMDVLTDEIEGLYDLIVSNPPYIASETLRTLDVSKHEPLLALDGGSDGLIFYRAIIPKAYAALADGGVLALEIGFDQGETVSSLMGKYFSSVSLKKDFGGNDRMIFSSKPPLPCAIRKSQQTINS